MNYQTLLKAAAVFAAAALLIYINATYLNFEAEQLQDFFLSFGLLGPAVFILMFAMRPFLLFPASVMAVAGGLAFGPIIGPAATYAGSLAGALLSFLFIRKIGSKKKQKLSGAKREVIKKRIEENGMFYIISLRILPVINFDLVTYLAAVSSIKLKTFLGATMIGIIPGTLAFNLLGASLADLSAGMIAATAAVFAIALIIPYVVKRMLKKKNMDLEELT
ncbi:TVP38/TMEM64 family protein [Alkalicoccus luteus]|uniref:TVP38/TMEM64 family membrane protein n=1 Tax=Alkalicoccus luteus TaxID=1237094 RepID=A0A969PQU4_9BACI|nr:TVP38/TMEM64 family protein [Alkalicoccus luteus]NJP37319.1 TVP38/TMEM64 family protein [Alkalicoccus luteus]